MTVKLLLDAIRADGGKRFLIDGFPRNTNNLSGWCAARGPAPGRYSPSGGAAVPSRCVPHVPCLRCCRQQQASNDFRVAGVLVFDCPEEVMEERLLERGKTSGRTDDNVDSIRKRFKTFKDETMPVLKYYEHQVPAKAAPARSPHSPTRGRHETQGLVTSIDGTRSPDEVWADTTAFIDGLEASLQAGGEVVRCRRARRQPGTSPAPSSPAHVSVPASVQVFTMHVYSTEHEKPYVADVGSRVAEEVRARWGDAVKVECSSFKVEQSLKPFGIDAIRAFD